MKMEEYQEGERCNPYQVFPQLVWEVILGHLYDPEDFEHVAVAFPLLKDIIDANVTDYLPPITFILPQVVRYLTLQDVFNCRLTTHRWKSGIDRGLRNRPFQTYYTNYRYWKTDDLATHLESSWDQDISNLKAFIEQAEEEVEEGRNPFLAGSMHLEFTGRWKYRVHDAFVRNVEKIVLPSLPIREGIVAVKISTERRCRFDDSFLLYYLLQNIFKYIKKLRHLYIDLREICIPPSPKERADILDLIWTNPLPDLPPVIRNKELTVKYFTVVDAVHPLLTATIFSKYFAQLNNVTLNLFFLRFEPRPRYDCNYLTRMTIVNMGNKSMNLLKTIFAPTLNYLELQWRPKEKLPQDGILTCRDDHRRNTKIPNMVKLGLLIKTNFPALKILRFRKTYFGLKLKTCCWHARAIYAHPKTTTFCHPLRSKTSEKEAAATIKENAPEYHFEHKHRAELWSLLPISVKLVQFDFLKYYRSHLWRKLYEKSEAVKRWDQSRVLV